jgi:hypothetical protein
MTESLSSPDPQKAAACGKKHAWADPWASPHGRTKKMRKISTCDQILKTNVFWADNGKNEISSSVRLGRHPFSL